MSRIVDMAGAVNAIRAMARPERLGAPVVVGITGPVGAGKSTLAGRLAGQAGCVISTDHYLPDYEVTPEDERDLPERSDLARLLADLEGLREGRPTRIPQWSFHTHSRVGETLIHPRELVVVEGLHALHKTHARALHVRVFIDAPKDVRWSRWENLSITGERGWSVEVTRAFFHNVAEPTFHARAQTYRDSADVVVVNA